MKKLFSFMICFCFVLASAFTFVACGNEKVSVDDASDEVEEVQVETFAFTTLLRQEADSQSRSPQERGIITAVRGGLNGLTSFASYIVLLDTFNDGKYNAEEYEMGEITKKGNTYTVTDDGDVTKIVVKSDKNSLTLTINETNIIKYTLAKNYLKIEVDYTYGTSTTKAYAEIKEVGNNHYYQLVQIEEETYNVVNFKYNFTEVEVGEVETATINSFSIVVKDGETTKPTSIKDLKNYDAYATGEGAITYTAQQA